MKANVMQKPNYQSLVQQLISADANMGSAARMMLIALQEDAIEPLADEFYAGVTDNQAFVIIELMAEIGGPDALNTLRQIFDYDVRPKVVHAAAQGLLKNVHSLSQNEREIIAFYIAGENE